MNTADNMIRRRSQLFIIVVVEKYGPASRCIAGIDIFPAISHQPGFRKFQLKLLGRLQQKPRLWFSAITLTGTIVITHVYLLDGKFILDHLMQYFNHRPFLKTPSHIRLVGYTENVKSAGDDLLTDRVYPLYPSEFRSVGWREGKAVADERLVNDPVAIEAHGSIQRVDSHLVS